MDQNIIAKVMSKVGPVVKTVVLRSNGKVDQVTIDMTSTKNELAKVLGGELTIIGQLNVLDCVLMKLADEEKKGLVRNTHKLPYPFHEEEHLGDILLMRMDEDSEPLSMTKDEWAGFLKTAPYTEDAYAAWKLENNVVDDEDEDDEEELTTEEQEIFEDVVEKLTKKLKKEPSQDQVLEALVDAGHLQIAEKLSMGGEDDDEDDFTEEEQQAIEKCMKTLEKKLKRSPSKAEVIETLAKAGKAELAAKLTMLAEASSDEEESEDDEEPQLKQLQGADDDDEQEVAELSEADQKTLDKMCETLAKKLKREPTKDEVVEALVKAGKGELAELVDQMSEGEDSEDDESEDDEAIYANLKKALGREPTEEEMKQALSDTGLTSNFTEEETMFMSNFIDELEAKLQRMATEEEVFDALKEAGKDEILAKLMEEAERDDADMELNEEDEEYMSVLIAKLSKKLKRVPEEEELMQALASSGDEQAMSILEKLMNNDDEEDDDDDMDDDDDEEEEEEVKPAPKKQQKKQPQQQQQQKKQPQQQQQKKQPQQQQKKQQQQGNPNKGKQQQRGPPQGRNQSQNKKARRG